MSPTRAPWRLDGDEIVSDATGEMIADFYDMNDGTLGADNAALAVQAVNCHQNLIDALHCVRVWINKGLPEYGNVPDIVRAAIAKAEGR